MKMELNCQALGLIWVKKLIYGFRWSLSELFLLSYFVYVGNNELCCMREDSDMCVLCERGVYSSVGLGMVQGDLMDGICIQQLY